ncbi:kinase-like domain-containing protein [Lipomyces tetrasporus]|uniref:non-specific serine/threonine protein kinase n=1 Tax=Lipomyces tetrasporus TaxID=54092 RepID=A0AAD7QSV8_9ASCO|nr:kinase-like domain-containing protein [Lipomyces tetrasporus]KAJ8100371.1 kinase-like domain-containing protein [Lipomyces tetrasporus]
MSIIPYSGDQNQSIVLHDPIRGAVVLFDRSSRQLSLHRDLSLAQPAAYSNDVSIVSRASNPRATSPRHWFQQAATSIRSPQKADTGHPPRFTDACPYCGRGASPIPDHNGARERHSPLVESDDLDGRVRSDRTFVDRLYFKLLQDASVTSSPSQSRSGTPIFGTSSSSALPEVHSAKSGISSAAYSQGYFERFFVTERELGRGGRGAVYLVEHVLDGVSLGQFACKKIPVGDDHKWLERVLHEVSLLRLSHTNLVNYNHVWLENSQLTNFGPSVPCVFILQEYCNFGTLEEYVDKRSGLLHRDLTIADLKMRARRLSRQSVNCAAQEQRKFLTLEEIGSFFIDITSGLNHLHQNGFVHRDLKPSNCLLNESAGIPGALPRVLVSDFGEGQREGTKRDATGATGTVGYSAPETLLPDIVTGELAEFSFKTDMFSMGMILHFLCFSRLPYEHDFDNSFDELREEVMRWKGFDKSKVAGVRSDLPSELYGLLSSLLSSIPKDRPSAEELLDLIGVTTESRRRKPSGTASKAPSPWAPPESSPSSTGPSPSIFSLCRSRMSPQPSASNDTAISTDPAPPGPSRAVPLLTGTSTSSESCYHFDVLFLVTHLFTFFAGVVLFWVLYRPAGGSNRS